MVSDLLRFTTAGSVDDGKSTLIGRLLMDAGLVFDDQLAALARVHMRPFLLRCLGGRDGRRSLV